jgi:Na+-driven multidrug efflux pump
VLGLNTAIISIIGQNFGSKNYLRVKESYFKAVIYGFAIMIISGLIIFVSADRIVSIFSDNQEVINYGSSYLKISALIFPAYPIFFISNGFFMAIKKSSYSMYLNIIRNVILPIPTILVAQSIDGGFNTFFWSYCFFNWLYVICLFIYVTSYIRKNLHQAS